MAVCSLRPIFYDNAGRLVRVSQTGQPDMLYFYDELGDVVLSGQDVDGNGALDLASSDRISSNSARYVQIDGTWWKESAQYQFPDAGSARSVRVSLHRSAISGSSCGCGAGERQTVDILGNTNTVVMTIDRDTKTKTITTTYADSIQPAVSVEVNGRLVSQTTKTGVTTAFGYDALGRRCSVRSVSGESSSRLTGTISHYNDHNQVDYIEDFSGNRTTFVYDSAGRRTAVIDALTNTTHHAYDQQGRVIASWGATYPVAYEYDALGRMTAMATTRDSSINTNLLALLPSDCPLSHTSHASYPSRLDTTRWLYNEATGLLTNKLYADNNGPSYAYDPAGRLTQRTWARGIDTHYLYDSLGQLTNIWYGQSLGCPPTAPISYAYDRLGRQTTARTEGVSTNLFSYDPATLALTQEVIQVSGFSPQPSTHVLARSYNEHGRPSGIALGPDYAVDYGYDSLGRFSYLSSVISPLSSNLWQYSYLPGSGLLLGYTNNHGLSAMRSFDSNRDLITQVENTHNGGLIHRFEYENDALGRRTLRRDVDMGDVISNFFGYNARSEVITALMGTNDYGYDYDPIGNRKSATNNAETLEYTANQLNQYTSITSTGAPSWSPSYDLDGNLTSYNGWTFKWNGENRLILASNSEFLVQNAYDHQGRRVLKTTKNKALGTTNQTQFVYDGWNLIAEIAHSTGSGQTTTNVFVWGLDLSGTLQGAGGVGGLLAEYLFDTNDLSSKLVYVLGDANGNVTDAIDTNGAVVAHYEYDAFGNTVSQSGTLSFENPFRFSTKYHEAENNFYYYGYRYYCAELGRWLNRDPIEENGGINIYGALINTPIGRVDRLGRQIININTTHSVVTDTNPCLNQCGAEVGLSLMQTMKWLEMSYYLASEDEQKKGCREQLWSLDAFGGWDMIMPEDVGSGNCQNTISIFGKCHYFWEVNYAMFGLLNKLCNSTKYGGQLRTTLNKISRVATNLKDGDYNSWWGNPEAAIEISSSLYRWHNWGYNGYEKAMIPSSPLECDACESHDRLTISAWPWLHKVDYAILHDMIVNKPSSPADSFMP